jgi:hypothetical protein
MSGIGETRGGINWRVVGWGGAAALLAAPFVAMRFTSEVNWSPGDFVFAGLLFGVVGLCLELAARSSSDWAWRGGVAFAALSGLMLVWANGAVGMIGNEDNPYNLLFLGLIPLALLGSAIVRFRAAGMAAVMLAAWVGQLAIAAGGFAQDARGGMFSILISATWLFAAASFRIAAGRESGGNRR